jgi:DNA repair protein RecO (recombination protein O)
LADPLGLMPPIASDALVLRSYKLGETSKIVVLLTRERGKVRAVAKGARGVRSRYQSALEPLSEVRATLYGRQGAELYRLGGCELIRSAYLAGSRGLEISLSFSYFAELLDAFCPEGEAEDAVYRLATAVIRAAEEGTPAGVLARYLEAWLLKLHGLYPPLDRCSACGAALPGSDRRYHLPAHGFICDRCGAATGPVLSQAALSFLLRLLKQGPGTLEDRITPPEVDAFHQQLIERHLERDLASLRMLKDLTREVAPS